MVTGRPWKFPVEQLKARLTAARAEGTSCKIIAAELGYSYEHVRKLCSRFGLSNKKALAPSNNEGIQEGRDHAPSANVPAATEAKPGDSANADS